MKHKENIEPNNENANTADNQFPLGELPISIIQKEIGQYLTATDQHNLSRMNNRNLFFAFLPGSLAAIKQLLLYIVRGEKNKVEAIIKRDPYLLLNKATVTDFSGRKIHGTAWQIAAGAEDVSIIDPSDKAEDETIAHEEMLQMIERYLKTLPNGELEIAKQKAEQFPSGWEEKEKERAQNDLIALNKVFNAIAACKTDQEYMRAFNEFRNDLQPKRIITTGKHFNAQLLSEAFKLFEEYYELFSWTGHKNNLIWRHVIGEIQFNLPACYAQALCQGLDNVIERKIPLLRQLLLNDNIHFYTRDENAKSGLAFDWAVDRKLGLTYTRYYYVDDEVNVPTMLWEALCNAKQKSLAACLKPNISEHLDNIECVKQHR